MTTNNSCNFGTGATNSLLHGSNTGTPTFSQVNLLNDVTSTLVAFNGGTGFNGYTIGDMLYADTTLTLSRLNAVATGNALISGGIGTAFSWGKISLTTTVSGQLPLANGGTNSNAGNFASNGIVFTSGSNLISTSALTYPFANVIQFQSTGNVNFTVQSTTPSGGAAITQLIRQDTSSYAELDYLTNATGNWNVGLRTGDSDLHWFSSSSSLDVMSLNPTNGLTILAGNLVINTAGKTLKVKQGSNACSGTGAVMVAGAVTVSTTAVATGDTVLLMKTASGGTSTTGLPVVTISNGVSFTITGGALDTSTWSWLIVKPS